MTRCDRWWKVILILKWDYTSSMSSLIRTFAEIYLGNANSCEVVFCCCDFESYYFFLILEGISLFFKSMLIKALTIVSKLDFIVHFNGATDSPVLDLWCICIGFQSQGGSLACVLHCLHAEDSSDSPLCNTCWPLSSQHGN